MGQKQEKAALPATNSQNVQGKGRNDFTEKQEVCKCLFEEPRTRAQVSHITGIWINSVCYYVGQLFEEGKAKVHHKGECPVRHSKNVEFLTTNPDYSRKTNNLLLIFGTA